MDVIHELIDDRALIKSIKRTNCNDCIGSLRDRHAGLIISQYHKYSSILHKLNFNPEEFNDEINFLVYDSARKFDLRRKKIKFSTYLADQTKWFCLNKINELKKRNTITAENNDITRLIDECYSHKEDDKTTSREMCNYIFSLLEQFNDKRVIKIFEMRYFQGKKYKNKSTWSDIGRELNLTSQAVINIYRKTIDKLRDKINSSVLEDRI